MEDPWKERLVAFYAVYNPSCVNSVDAILSTYKGREGDLLKVLVAKYGPEPSALAPPASQPRSSSATVEQAQRRSETPLELLAKDDDAHTASAAGSAQQRTTTADLITSLVRKYGPEQGGSHPQPTLQTRQQADAQSWEHRFYNFFSYYRPDKLSGLPEKLARHEGREMQWMQSLVLKYGPEPPPRKFLAPPRADPDVRSYSHNSAHNDDHRSSGVFNSADDSPPPASTAKFGDRATHAYARRPSSLSSPSPPSHPIYQPVLAQRFQQPQHSAATPGGPGDDQNKSSADLSEVVTKLTGALDQKTRELLKFRAEKIELEEKLEKSVQDNKARAHELSTLVDRAMEAEKETRDVQAARDSLALQCSRLAAELEDLANIRTEHQTMSRTLASREHQCRSQRNEIDQIAQELELRERQLSELSTTLRELHAINKSLVEENSELRLALVDPGSESRFHKVVEEIQEASSRSFDHRRKVLEVEMQQYYEYAKHQIGQRDATIRVLGDQLAAALAESSRPLGEPAATGQRTSFPPDASERRVLAEEIARLKLQMSVQAEEYKTLLASHRRTAELAPPSHQNGEVESMRQEIDTLRQRLRHTEDEASVAKEALQSELRQQVEEMKDIHERVDAYEREKNHLISTINELKTKSDPLHPTDSESKLDSIIGGLGGGNSFTRSNVWSLLYER